MILMALEFKSKIINGYDCKWNIKWKGKIS